MGLPFLAGNGWLHTCHLPVPASFLATTTTRETWLQAPAISDKPPASRLGATIAFQREACRSALPLLALPHIHGRSRERHFVPNSSLRPLLRRGRTCAATLTLLCRSGWADPAEPSTGVGVGAAAPASEAEPSSPAPAADPAAQRKRADAAFQRGQAHRHRGELEPALAEFERAYEIQPEY